MISYLLHLMLTLVLDKNLLFLWFFLLSIYLLFYFSLQNHLKIIKIPISIISFVDDRLFISQNKFISHSNTNLFCSYNIILSLLMKCSLVVEYGKTDIFHFSRSHGMFNPPSLDLSTLGVPFYSLKKHGDI